MNIYEYTYNKYFTHHVALFKSRYLFLKDTSERCCLSRTPRISPMYEYQRLANTIHISDVRAQIAHLYRTSDEAATHPPIYADVFFVYRHLRQSNIFAGRLMRQHTTHTHTRNFILFMLAFWVLLYLYAQQQKKNSSLMDRQSAQCCNHQRIVLRFYAPFMVAPFARLSVRLLAVVSRQRASVRFVCVITIETWVGILF